MPYGPRDIPSRLRGKGIPAKFIRLYKHVFNSVFKATGSEVRAHKAATKRMGQALRKAGYRKSQSGRWLKR